MPEWNDEAFAALFGEIYPKLCRYLEGLTGRGGAAQEIAQEAFVRLLRIGPGRIAPGEERFWLFRVAGNLALNEIRRRRARERVVGVVAGLFGRVPSDPFEHVDRTERASALRAALAKLPERQRAALLLREFEGLSYDEIGRLLGVPLASVKSDIFRARARLRDLLGDSTASAGGSKVRSGHAL